MFGFKSKARRAYEAREKGVFHYAMWLYGDLALSVLKFVGVIVAGVWAYKHRDALKASIGKVVEAARVAVRQIRTPGKC